MTAVLEELTTPGEETPTFDSGLVGIDGLPCGEPGCDYVAQGDTAPMKLGAHRWAAHKLKTPKAKGTAKKRGRPRKATGTATHRGEVVPGRGKPPAEPAPPPRREGSELFSMLVVGAGMLLGQIDRPVGRMLMFEAPAAGPICDQAAAGTPIDRWFIQPAMSGWERLEQVGPLIAAPLSIAWLERDPDNPIANMMLEQSVESMLPQMLAAELRKAEQQNETEQVAQKLIEIDPAYADLLIMYDERGNQLSPAQAFIRKMIVPAVADPEQGSGDAQE